MKNFKLLLAGAIMIAVGSSFAANGNHKVAGEYVLDSSGTRWELKDPNGICVASEDICNYTKTGSATTPEHPDQFENPANFTPNQLGTYTE